MTELCHFFADASRRREALVLATVVRTEGSTYRKAGARILISQSGSASGLLSGGCLEEDLRERAVRVLVHGRPARAVFDLRTSDDAVWGVGLGCEGVNDIWLQAVTQETDYAPLPYLSQRLNEKLTGMVATVVGGEALPGELGRHGCAGVLDEDPLIATLSACSAAKPEIQKLRYRDRTLEVFVAPVVLPPALLLCGGGPDSVPLARFCDLLGWEVTVVDHRPAFASAALFPPTATVLLAYPEELTHRFRFSQFDAAVIMSHNLAMDVEYLRLLAKDAPRYIGLLGPAARRARIIDEVGPAVLKNADCIHGPVGLDIGANTPAGIGLAIVAQIHAVLGGRRGADYASVPIDCDVQEHTRNSHQ